MTVLETPRLRLRQLTLDDAAFVLELVNDPAWLRFIGDRGVRNLDGARIYLTKGPLASYAQHGFGLWLTERKDDGVPLGICGLLKRETLEDIDIGFALLPKYWSAGYASEAAKACLEYGRHQLTLKRIVAITSPDNVSSIRLLEKLGLRFEKTAQLSAGAAPIKLFAIQF